MAEQEKRLDAQEAALSEDERELLALAQEQYLEDSLIESLRAGGISAVDATTRLREYEQKEKEREKPSPGAPQVTAPLPPRSPEPAPPTPAKKPETWKERTAERAARQAEKLRQTFEKAALKLLPKTGQRRVEQVNALAALAKRLGIRLGLADLTERIAYLRGKAEMPSRTKERLTRAEAEVDEQPPEEEPTTIAEARNESFGRLDSMRSYVENLAGRKPENLRRIDKVYDSLLKTRSTKFDKWKELAGIGLSLATIAALPLGGSASALTRMGRMLFGSFNYSTIGFRMGSEFGLRDEIKLSQERYEALMKMSPDEQNPDVLENILGEQLALYRAGVRFDQFESNRQGLKLFGKAGEVFQKLKQGKIFESGKTLWSVVAEDRKELLKLGGKMAFYSTPLIAAALAPGLALPLYAGTTGVNMVERIMRYRQLGATGRAEWEGKAKPDTLLNQIRGLADRYDQELKIMTARVSGVSPQEVEEAMAHAQSGLRDYSDENYLHMLESRGRKGLALGTLLGAISASFYGIMSHRSPAAAQEQAPAKASGAAGAGGAAGALTPREGAPAPAPETTAPRGFGPPAEGASAPAPGEQVAPGPGRPPGARGPEQFSAPGPGRGPLAGPPVEGAPAPAPGGVGAPPPGEGVPAGPPGTGEVVGKPSDQPLSRPDRYSLSAPEGSKPIPVGDEFEKPYELKGNNFINIDINGDGTFDPNERCEVIDGKYYKLLYADQNGDGVAEKLPQGHYLKVDIKTHMAYEYDTRGTKVSDEVWQVSDKDNYMRHVAGTEAWDKARAEHSESSVRVGDHYETKGWGTVARRGMMVDLNALEGNPNPSVIDKIPELQTRMVGSELVGNYHGIEIHFTGQSAQNFEAFAGGEVTRQALEGSVFRFEPASLKISHLQFPASMSTESLANLMLQHRAELPPSLRALITATETTNPITGETNRPALLRWLGEARVTEGGVSKLTLEKLTDIRTNHAFEVVQGNDRYIVIEGATIRDTKQTVTRELIDRYKGQVVPIEQLTQPGGKSPEPPLTQPPAYGLSSGPYQ